MDNNPAKDFVENVIGVIQMLINDDGLVYTNP